MLWGVLLAPSTSENGRDPDSFGLSVSEGGMGLPMHLAGRTHGLEQAAWWGALTEKSGGAGVGTGAHPGILRVARPPGEVVFQQEAGS